MHTNITGIIRRVRRKFVRVPRIRNRRVNRRPYVIYQHYFTALAIALATRR